MSIFVSRQFSAFTVLGAQTSPSAVFAGYQWQMNDRPLKYILQLDDGKVSSGTIIVPTMGTFTLPLPTSYTTASLCISIVTSDTVRLDIEAGFLKQFWLKAGANQQAIFSGTMTAVSTVVLNNATAADVTAQYFMYEVPDLTQATSYRIGDQATGIQQDSADATPGWV